MLESRKILKYHLTVTFYGKIAGTYSDACKRVDGIYYADSGDVTRAAVEPEFHFWFRVLRKRWLKLVGEFEASTLRGVILLFTTKVSLCLV